MRRLVRRAVPWVAGAYALALLGSWAWRWWHPFHPLPHADERSIPVARFVADGPTAGPAVQLSVVDLGSSDSSRAAVVLIHGSPGSNSEMKDLARLLAADRRAIAPSLPGFGTSTRAVADYSFRAHARYVLAALDSLGVRRAHLIGFSMGGGVAISAADLAPQRVASLTLLSSIGAQEYELLGDFRLNRAVHGFQLAILWLVRETTPHFGALDGAFLGVEYARNFYDSDQRPLRPTLARLEMPVFIVQGAHDDLVHPAVALEHHRIVPHSELLLLDDPGATHFMTFTRPAELAPAIAGFLARVDRGDAPTRARAAPERRLAAARPFDPGSLPKATGLTLAVLLLLIAAATFVSEDLACIATGLLVGRGTIAFVGGTMACFAGIVVGDLGLYVAGRWLGRPAVRRAPLRWLVREADIVRTSAWFDRHGAWIALLTRFVPGTRLPTYVAAGVLQTRALQFLGVFVLAAALWTPLLVGASAVFGSQVLAAFTEYQRFALPTLLAIAAGLFLGIKLIRPLASWRGRRLLLSRWRRLVRWEFWPRWAFYPPVALYILWLGLKHRSLLLWTASNPAIPGGGFVGESKAGILEGLQDPARVAAWRLLPGTLPVAERLQALEHFRHDAGLTYPLVLKPDVGERGSGVQVVPDAAAAARYLEQAHDPVLVQEYVPGVEFGVFYYRLPGEASGRIFAITEKRFPAVTGDGLRTLEALILADDRAVSMARFFLSRHADQLHTIPTAGAVVPLVDLGTHCRGSAFFDGEDVRSPALEAAIDRLSRGYDGFWFGRYDIRAPSREAVREGRDFKVIELNGSGSEATNIYDPANRLTAAYRTLRRQWALAFEIGRRNAERGARPSTWRELRALLRQHRRAVRAHVTT